MKTMCMLYTYTSTYLLYYNRITLAKKNIYIFYSRKCIYKFFINNDSAVLQLTTQITARS